MQLLRLFFYRGTNAYLNVSIFASSTPNQKILIIFNATKNMQLVRLFIKRGINARIQVSIIAPFINHMQLICLFFTGAQMLT